MKREISITLTAEEWSYLVVAIFDAQISFNKREHIKLGQGLEKLSVKLTKAAASFYIDDNRRKEE